MDLFEMLNEKQAQAVRTTEGFVRVIAGAGSGKTKLLVSRYAYLVTDYGIDPANILCVTFTNKAAGEMKHRIRSLIGAEYDTSLICTYHGFCVRLLREDPEKLFLTKRFQIIDTVQQKAILEEIYQKYELKLDHASFERILKHIGYLKSTQPYVSGMCNPEPCCILPQITTEHDRIAEDYMQKQKALYALDFHDLIEFALHLLRTDKDVREKWQARLNYIQVDEFQDSSRREMELVDLLAGQYCNVMIVGDPDQNIYEWRGSDVKLLVDFDRAHHPTETIFLNRNYRSTPQILRCANTLIDRNELRLKKDLYTELPEGASVVHYHTKSDFDEVNTIVDQIRKLRNSRNYTYSDFAVLYRSGFLSRVVEKRFVESNIPYEIYGGVKFYQRMEVQDIIAYLKLIAYDDDMAFKRIVNTPRRKIGRAKIAYLEQAQESELSLFDGEKPSLLSVLRNCGGEKLFQGSGSGAFVSMIDGFRRTKNRMRISELVCTLCEASGYEQYIRELGDEERLDNLAEFKRIADEFERSYGEDLTLEQFLQEIALQSAEDDDKPREAVKLMTVHAAKGLEFPVVFLIGMTEGVFPSAKTVEERKKLGLEEERRLCYVAITRAKEYLYLMDSEGLSQNGMKNLPSRFLREIGEEHYVRIGTISPDLDAESRRYAEKIGYTGAPTQAPQTGASVEHHVFGKGTVLSVDEKRGSYVIQFENLTQPRTLSKTYFEQKQQTPPDVPKPVPTPESKTGPIPEPQSEPESEVTKEKPEISDELRKKLEDSENLWKREDVPHSGWICTGVTDLGAPVGVCEMCGHQIIRYVHHMRHASYRPLNVGCECAGKMEGDVAGARKREREFRNRQKRLETFRNRKWRQSQNGNPYLKIKEHVVLLYRIEKSNKWKYAVDNVFSQKIYPSREAATDAVFELVDQF